MCCPRAEGISKAGNGVPGCPQKASLPASLHSSPLHLKFTLVLNSIAQVSIQRTRSQPPVSGSQVRGVTQAGSDFLMSSYQFSGS